VDRGYKGYQRELEETVEEIEESVGTKKEREDFEVYIDVVRGNLNRTMRI